MTAVSLICSQPALFTFPSRKRFRYLVEIEMWVSSPAVAFGPHGVSNTRKPELQHLFGITKLCRSPSLKGRTLLQGFTAYSGNRVELVVFSLRLHTGEPESLGYLENHPADNNLFAFALLQFGEPKEIALPLVMGRSRVRVPSSLRTCSSVG